MLYEYFTFLNTKLSLFHKAQVPEFGSVGEKYEK